MATVHVGRLVGPVGFARTVAIKKMHATLARDPEFVSMFVEEARIAARVQHANVVATLDVVNESGELFHVIDYVDGDSLAKLLAAARQHGLRLPIPVVGAVLSQALHGLHAVHETRGDDGRPLGLIHRDVSPDNMLVGRDGMTRVLDFGIAKATEHGRRTQVGQIKGKVTYMAPEQIRAQPLDRRIDVYAAGAVLWEALAGKRLVEGETEVEMVHNVLTRTPQPPSKLVPGIAPAIDALVMKSLARDPAARFATALEMALAVETTLGVASQATIAQLVERLLAADLSKKAALVEEAVRRTAELASRPENIASASTIATHDAARRARSLAETAATPPPSLASAGTLPQGSLAAPAVMGPGASSGPVPSPAAPAPMPIGGTDVMSIPDLFAAGERDVRRAAPSLEVEIPKVPTLQVAGAEPAPAAAAPAATAPPAPPRAPEPAAPQPSGLSLEVDFGTTRTPHQSAPAAPWPTPTPSSAPRSSGPSHQPPPPFGVSSAGPMVRPAMGGYGAVGPAPSAGRSSLMVAAPIAIGALIIVAVALVLVFRGSSSTPQDSSAKAAPPPSPEETQACDILRQRLRSGGSPVGLSRAGWAVEIWLRGEGGKKIEPSAIDTKAVATPSDIVEITERKVPGKDVVEGVLVRLRGPTAESAFDEAGALKLVKAADAMFDQTRAESASMTLKCAHLPHTDLGMWFRGRDLRSASASLVFSMAMFADTRIVREEALETKDVRADMPYYERLHAKLFGPKTKDLETDIERYGATVDEPGPNAVRITFPAARLQDAIRASRVVADKAGVENL